MKKGFRIFVITCLTLGTVVVFSLTSFAATDCLSFDLTVQRSDAELRQLLAICEAESTETASQLKAQQAKSSTIASDVAYLDALIKKSQQQITIKNQIISQLNKQISQKQSTIVSLSDKLDREHESLAQIIRTKNEIGGTTFAEAFLSDQTISGLLVDVDNLRTINKSIQDSLDVVRGVRVQTTKEKQDLEVQKIQQANLKNQIEADKRQTELQQQDKKTLLNQSKSEEKTYQQLLAVKQAKAASIRSRLFELAGGAPGQGIPFGDAYAFAKEAGQKTGIRPAFILAILTQESNLGKNVGTCNRAGDSRTWHDIMPGPNSNSHRDDQSAYLRIVQRLGISPDGQPLSCPMASGGWGGAMGPSQFIPTTWELFASRIETALGVSTANPWLPLHAITATALYMQDLGAQNSANERDAACRYYSGGTCSARGGKNAFYGNAVIALAQKIQADIDVLESAN